MTHAAPGDFARGALRRKLPEYLRVSVRNSDRYLLSIPYRMGKESILLPYESRFEKCSYFTLHLSGFGVERGRMGEVVSLVGDCRPPPPGNPRQPTNPDGNIRWIDWRHMNPPQVGSGQTGLTTIKRKNGGIFLSVTRHCSFNNNLLNTNLKDLDIIQYFKNNRSYFSCVGKNPVLKFEHFNSHLCGLKEVEPPSIVITNVLGT